MSEECTPEKHLELRELGYKYCTKCYKHIEEGYCLGCGKEVKEKWDYCPWCGEEL